jgi:hypothetical protein
MKRASLIVGYLLLTIVLVSGCVPILLGAGVAGGIMVTKDSVQLQYDTDLAKAWKAVHSAFDRMGIINVQDEKGGTIDGTIQESHVTARITPVTTSSVKIEVKARKNLLPDMDLANKVINDINNRLHSSP